MTDEQFVESSAQSSTSPQLFVFTQVFNFTKDEEGEQETSQNQFEAILEQFANNYEAHQQSGWEQHWREQGEAYVLQQWRIKYADYLLEPQYDVAEASSSSSIADVEPATNEEVGQDNSTSWQFLWEQHLEQLYLERYTLYTAIFHNYHLDLKRSLQTKSDAAPEHSSASTTAEETAIEAELEQLKLLGLPTKFGSRPQKREKTRKTAAAANQKEYNRAQNDLTFSDEEEEEEEKGEEKVEKYKEKQEEVEEKEADMKVPNVDNVQVEVDDTSSTFLHAIANQGKSISKQKPNEKKKITSKIRNLMEAPAIICEAKQNENNRTQSDLSSDEDDETEDSTKPEPEIDSEKLEDKKIVVRNRTQSDFLSVEDYDKEEDTKAADVVNVENDEQTEKVQAQSERFSDEDDKKDMEALDNIENYKKHENLPQSDLFPEKDCKEESMDAADVDTANMSAMEVQYRTIRKDSSLKKYWSKRFSLFSRFDKGIQLDRESWFSVTPELVAAHMAKRLACDLIVDGLCGSGGNTIQFAKTCRRVIAIDIDPVKVENAKHNARIYGVADRIDFRVGDFMRLCCDGSVPRANCVFLSPPWGGPKYKKCKDYDIELNLLPVGASKLVEHAQKISDNVALFLPRNSNMKQVIKLAGAGNRCEVEHNHLNGRSVGITALYGDTIISNK